MLKKKKSNVTICESDTQAPLVRRGFSLLEAIIAVCIFSLLVVMISGTFSGFLKNFNNAKKTQRRIESAQYAMNVIAKSIRTSNVSFGGTTNLFAYDHSQGKCIKYFYDSIGKSIRITTSNQADPGDISGCDWLTSVTTSDLASRDIESVSFLDSVSTIPGAVHIVTIALGVREQGDNTILPVQTTVSLRNYTVSPSTCTHTCSTWGACVAGSQTCTAETLSPAGCTGGTSAIGTTQSCAVADSTPPTFSINDGVSVAYVQNDTVNVTVSDATGVASMFYGFSADNTCDASDTITTAFTSATNFTISGNHSDYLCLKATDSASPSNTGYQLVGQLHTDNTVPVVSAFTLPATSSSLTVTISSFTVTDAGGLAGMNYCVTTTSDTSGCGWAASPQNSITFASYGNNQAAYAWAKDAAGNVSASKSATVSIQPDWLTGPCGFLVYKQDMSFLQWKTSNTSCVSPQCPSGGMLSSDNSIDFSQYPARDACKAVGGRLPDWGELNCIYTNRASYPGLSSGGYYPSSFEQYSWGVMSLYFWNGTPYTSIKTDSNYARCVK